MSTISSAADGLSGDVVFTDEDATDDEKYEDVNSDLKITPKNSFQKDRENIENHNITNENMITEAIEEDDIKDNSEKKPEEKKKKIELPELTEEEEKKMLEAFVVKDLDNNTVSNLLEVTEQARNPIYEHLVGVVKDYDENQPNVQVTAPLSPNQGDESLAKIGKGWNNVINKVIKKKTPIKEKETENKYKHKSNQKSIKQFSNLKLNQKIEAHAGAIWTMKFSTDGSYLATGGQDGYLIIWKINLKNEQEEEQEEEKNCEFWIEEEPHKKFLNGKYGDILDLDWSSNNFLVVSTMDKKVRVFHISRDECLGVFPHSDIVTSVKFHPTNESLFITGSFDEKLRLFNLRERELIHFIDTKYMITCVGFSGDGKIAMAGTFDGKCLFYNCDLTEGFKKITLLDVRSRRGQNKGRKVTGIELTKDKDQVLISTNDSRIRLYSLYDYSISCKYAGLSNQESQISGSFSHDGKFIISGSEDNSVYIWNTDNEYFSTSLFSKVQKDKNISFESFSDHSSIVTNAQFPPFDKYSKKGNKKLNEKKLLDATDYLIFTGDFKGEIRVFENL
eukprot:gene7493-11816_t